MKTQREGLRCSVESDAAEGPVVKTMRVLLAHSLGKCMFREIDRGKSEARLPSSFDHGHLEVHLDCACVGRATEDRESSISVDRFLKDRWLVARSKKCEGTQYRWTVGKLVNEVITSGMKALVVKSDQEASSVDVKSVREM